MDSGVAAVIITGIFGIILFIIQQFYKGRNDRNPPAAEIAPSTSADMWKHILAQGAKLEETQLKVATLERQVQEERGKRESLMDAVKRYWEKLAAHWGGPDEMPMPDDSDWDTLRPMMPRTRRARGKD